VSRGAGRRADRCGAGVARVEQFGEEEERAGPASCGVERADRGGGRTGGCGGRAPRGGAGRRWDWPWLARAVAGLAVEAKGWPRLWLAVSAQAVEVVATSWASRGGSGGGRRRSPGRRRSVPGEREASERDEFWGK
jgi:hypothetical protein